MKKILNWYYGKASIRRKLVISYLVLVLLPLVVLGSYSYRIARRNLLMQTKDAISSNVSSISYNLEGSVQREDDNLKYLSYNASFREKIESGSKNLTSLVQELNHSVEPVFWYFITSDRNIKGLEIYTPYIEKAVGSFLKPAEECLDKEWYTYHQTNFKSKWTCEDGRIFVTRTMLDAATSSRPIGVMKLEVYPDRFIEPLNQSRYLENGMVLLDADGQEIASRALKNTSLENEIRKHITSLAAKGIDAAERADAADAAESKDDNNTLDDTVGVYDTKNYILDVAEPFENGWRLFYYVDKQEIAGAMNQILVSTLLVVGVCLLVITILISVISRILSTRILKLKNCADQVGRGDFNVVTESGYTDEIGVVARSFGVMSHKINEMMNEMYRMGLEKRATELKALQAMINPHFLYNCLSSIKWKAIRADQDAIADITGLLAKFYRTTLNEGKQITIVRNELENVRAYLEIQSRMHEGSFDIDYDISDEGLDWEMPNFLLQPIVENAVCHGVDYCEEGEQGFIRVEYAPQGEFLLFHIYNNGPRMEEKELQRILNEPGKGYGIYNIQERIRMYYNEECGVYVKVTEEGLVCFTIKILRQIIDRIGENRNEEPSV